MIKILIGEFVRRVKLPNASLLEIESTQWRSLEKRGLKYEMLSVSKTCEGMFRFQIKVQKLPSGYIFLETGWKIMISLLLFCRGRLGNVQSFKTHVRSSLLQIIGKPYGF